LPLLTVPPPLYSFPSPLFAFASPLFALALPLWTLPSPLLALKLAFSPIGVRTPSYQWIARRRKCFGGSNQ